MSLNIIRRIHFYSFIYSFIAQFRLHSWIFSLGNLYEIEKTWMDKV